MFKFLKENHKFDRENEGYYPKSVNN